jgi:DNA modification methylase
MLNQIMLGDCIEIMKSIEDNSIDMILCDLPYGVTARNSWDEIIPFDELWKAYKRIIKSNGAIVLTATQPFASKLIISNYEMFRYDLIWVKNKKTGFLNAKKMPLRNHEHILVFYNNLPTYNPQKTTGHKPVNSYTKHTSDGTNYGNTNVGISGGGQTDRYPTSILSIPVVNNDSKDKYHPTQKPIELMEYLIKTYTNENDIVLDNCIGSGTTAIAAINTKRQFTGIEKEKEYYDIAVSRINERLK